MKKPNIILNHQDQLQPNLFSRGVFINNIYNNKYSKECKSSKSLQKHAPVGQSRQMYDIYVGVCKKKCKM